jgi:hypothetical protein
MTTITGFRSILLAACAAMLAPAALGQEPTVFKDGIAQLPTSGFVIDLKPKAGIEYHVSGSWALDEAAEIYDSRDVIDEIDPATETVVTGNWVITAYFNAGGCEETLAGLEFEDNDWWTSLTAWGQTWRVRGGRFDLGEGFGKVGTAALCRQAEGEPALLMYHFAVREPTPHTQQSITASVLAASPLAGTSAAYDAKRASSIFPTKRADVRNRGDVSHLRTVTLPATQLRLTLPEDGYVWLDNKGDGVDFLDRVLPSMPSLSVELVYVQGQQCSAFLDSLTATRRTNHSPLVVPNGWVTGPTLDIEGEAEMTLCNPRGADILVVGIFQGETNRDVSSLHPLLAALAAGVRQ